MNEQFILKNKLIIKTILKKINIIKTTKKKFKFSNKNIILDFLKIAVIPKKYISLNNFVNNFKLNKYSDQYIHNYIENNYKTIIYLINNNKDYKINIPKLLFSYFLPYDIFLDITLFMNYYEHIIIKYKKTILNFHFYYNKSAYYNITHIKLLCYIYTLFFIEYFNKTENITINIFLSNIEKLLPTNSKILKPTNINSGFTDFYNKLICIFRYEELYKVLLHEMVHILNLDLNIQKSNKLNKLIKCNFSINNINTNYNFFESYTETIANLFNLSIKSIILNKNIKKLYSKEINFSILQLIKILKFYNIKNIKQFYKNECFKKHINKEDTSVLSYFFFKTALLIDINFFIKNIMFKKNINIKKIYKIVIKNLLKILNCIFTKKYTNLILDSNLKMTIT